MSDDKVNIPESIDIGEGTIVKEFVLIDRDVKIGAECSVGRYCEIRSGCLIGDNVSFGSRCTLSAGTIIGSNVTIKYGFVACDTPDLDDPDLKVPPAIGDGAKIGANVTLMPGVKIGKGAVIGACSQVRRDVPAGEVWYGNPAKRAGGGKSTIVTTCDRCGGGRELLVTTSRSADGIPTGYEGRASPLCVMCERKDSFDCGNVSLENLRDGPE